MTIKTGEGLTNPDQDFLNPHSLQRSFVAMGVILDMRPIFQNQAHYPDFIKTAFADIALLAAIYGPDALVEAVDIYSGRLQTGEQLEDQKTALRNFAKGKPFKHAKIMTNLIETICLESCLRNIPWNTQETDRIEPLRALLHAYQTIDTTNLTHLTRHVSGSINQADALLPQLGALKRYFNKAIIATDGTFKDALKATLHPSGTLVIPALNRSDISSARSFTTMITLGATE